MSHQKTRLKSAIIKIALACTASLLPHLTMAKTAKPPVQTPANTINHIMVIQLENESYASTFSNKSPAKYLNGTLRRAGQLIPNWFATGHVSLDNYVAQLSGQGSNPLTNSDCDLNQYVNMLPGTDDSNHSAYPGQVDGSGCVFPTPTATTNGARTIGDQLDLAAGQIAFTDTGVTYTPGAPVLWREYAEDMGNTPSRDGGDTDPLGGTDCAHPAIAAANPANSATSADQYATRHNGFLYFHSVIDNQARCDAHVVPLGTVSVGTGTGGADVFASHLYQDLSSLTTTPEFMFITPNLCNDGHDVVCQGVNTEGTHTGGLAGADIWLKHWMPMIFNSPAYQSGQLLVVLTFDEGSPLDTAACNKALANTAICAYPTGPNMSNDGYSPLLNGILQTNPTTTGVYPGGGQVGAVLFNKLFIKPGSLNRTGQYNHYSALRSYEDLLHITSGGDDGLGHLGYAAQPGLAGATFGKDVFNQKP
jgi:hypothetical protein